MSTTLAFLSLPYGTELVVILVVGLLFFGRRLPEVGRSLGRTIVEFKKGIRGVEDDIEDASRRPSPPPSHKLATETPAAATSEEKVGTSTDHLVQ